MTASLESTRPGEVLDRRDLFYGTDSVEHVRMICTHNFDRNLSHKRDTKHGNGVYFSRDATYSDMFTEGPTCYMFLAHVLVGQFTRGEPEFRHPPPLPGGWTGLYDSCVNSVVNPSVFVLFEESQYYPAYLLQYRYKDKYSDEISWFFSTSGQSTALERTSSIRSYYGPRPPSPAPNRRQSPTRSLTPPSRGRGNRGRGLKSPGATRRSPLPTTFNSIPTAYNSYRPPTPPLKRSSTENLTIIDSSTVDQSPRRSSLSQKSTTLSGSRAHLPADSYLFDQIRSDIGLPRFSSVTSYRPPTPPRRHSPPPTLSSAQGHASHPLSSCLKKPQSQSTHRRPSQPQHTGTPSPSTSSGATGSHPNPYRCSCPSPANQYLQPLSLLQRSSAFRPPNQPVGDTSLPTRSSAPSRQGSALSGQAAQPAGICQASTTPTPSEPQSSSLRKPEKKKRCSIM